MSLEVKMVLVVFIRICGIVSNLFKEVSIVQGCLLRARLCDNYLQSTTQMTCLDLVLETN